MSLYNFLTCYQFQQGMQTILPNVFHWQVRRMPLAQRIAAVQDYQCFLLLKKQSKAMNLHTTDAEILSWLDNIVLVHRLLSLLDTTDLIDLSLGLEVKILPSAKRIDILLYRGHQMMIVETCYNLDALNNTLQEDNERQIQDYVKILQLHHLHYLSIQTAIINFLPEADASGKVLYHDQQAINNQSLQHLASRIHSFFFEK
ncbi:MAG: hypothetical protein WCQ80_03380 [Bacilli bacterium]